MGRKISVSTERCTTVGGEGDILCCWHRDIEDNCGAWGISAGKIKDATLGV